MVFNFTAVELIKLLKDCTKIANDAFFVSFFFCVGLFLCTTVLGALQSSLYTLKDDICTPAWKREREIERKDMCNVSNFQPPRKTIATQNYLNRLILFRN